MTKNWDRLESKKLWVFHLYKFNYRLSKLGWFCNYNYSLCRLYNGYCILINTTSSIWMLLITLSKLGLSFSSMLPSVAIALSSSLPPPPISSKQVCSSSSSKLKIGDPKVVLNLFLSNEVTGSRLNLSLGVGSSVHVFSRWNWCVGKGNVVVEHVGFLSFKNCSLVIGLGETYCCYTT